MLVLSAALQLHWLDAIWYQHRGVYFLLQNYLQHPLDALLLSCVQVQQMAYRNILIAYMLLMFTLQALQCRHWWLVASLSLTVWVFDQVNSDTFFSGVIVSYLTCFGGIRFTDNRWVTALSLVSAPALLVVDRPSRS